MPRTKKLSRDEVLVRAAKVRAKIMTLVTRKPGITSQDVLTALNAFLVKESIQEHVVTSQMHQLTAAGEIVYLRDGRHFKYFVRGDLKKVKALAKTAEPKAPEAKPIKVDGAQVIKVDGPVRLVIGKLVIDIGILGS